MLETVCVPRLARDAQVHVQYCRKFYIYILYQAELALVSAPARAESHHTFGRREMTCIVAFQ